MDEFVFTPEQGFLDTGVYTDPTSETEARTQLFSLHQQTRDFINDMVSTMNTMQREIDLIPAVQGDEKAMQDILDALALATPSYVTDTITAPASNSDVYANGYKKTYNDSVITDASEAFISFPNDDYSGKVTWETRNPGVGEDDGYLDVYFSADPTGLAIRIVLIGTQAV